MQVALKRATGMPLGRLQADFRDYLGANGLTAERESIATQLVGLATDTGAELWHDPAAEPYITISEDGHAEHYRLRTKPVRRWLGRLYYDEQKAAPGSQAVQDALNVLEAKACFDGDEYAVHTRLAGDGDDIVLDLGTDQWDAVRVTPKGWHPLARPPVRFIRSKGLLPHPAPQAGGGIAELRRLVNVRDEDWPLVVAWLLAALRPQGPYPILVLMGEQGSAKSTTARILRSLVDPNVSPLRTPPREVRDLMIAARHGWVIALDNLSSLQVWLSDALCILATGGGLSTRELFSDDDEILFDSQRPILLNGIDNFVARGDLADRAIVVTLPTIADDQRRREAEIWADFEALRPRVLGALLDVASAGLANLPNVELDGLPRMADFAQWAVACEPALGWEPKTFMNAYSDARANLTENVLDGDPVAPVLREWLAELTDEGWSGRAGELLGLLNTRIGLDSGKRPPHGWPKSPHGLAGALRRLAPALRSVGVTITEPRAGDKRRIYSIAPTRTEAQSNAQNAHKAHSASGTADTDGRLVGEVGDQTPKGPTNAHPKNDVQDGKQGEVGEVGVSLPRDSKPDDYIQRHVGRTEGEL
ncbi:hypothetical protein [Aquisalimonas sp.]|uniref:hypothetical protein n=1 Tax=Aquisalimonas sp. TaxID=1872621 RepID=UPI0025C08DF3|nr:hypothetical protein [Aquisalimonas sp.]